VIPTDPSLQRGKVSYEGRVEKGSGGEESREEKMGSEESNGNPTRSNCDYTTGPPITKHIHISLIFVAVNP
jgi:hypothetical protein